MTLSLVTVPHQSLQTMAGGGSSTLVGLVAGIAIGVLAILLYFWCFWHQEYKGQRRAMAAMDAADRCQLAKDRILYIGQLRTALKKCRRYIGRSGGDEAQRLINIIDELTTAVDPNGQPLKKHELH